MAQTATTNAPLYYTGDERWSFDLLQQLPPDQAYAFFIDPDDGQTLEWLSRLWALRNAQYSPYNVVLDKQYVMYLVTSEMRLATAP